MAATNQDIKDFFALNTSLPEVTSAHLLRFQAALETQRYGEDGAEADADDAVDWLYRHAKAFVNQQTENAVKATVEPDPDDMLD